MSNFDRAVENVLREEGGATITNDPKDPGGLTKYGISKRAHPDLDIANLTEGDAKRVYKEEYWDKLPMDQLDDRLAFCLLDTAVNCGVRSAAVLLQRACGVVEDGKIGPVTVAASKRADIVERFLAERVKYYTSLHTFGTFGTGWLVRCFRVARSA